MVLDELEDLTEKIEANRHLRKSDVVIKLFWLRRAAMAAAFRAGATVYDIAQSCKLQTATVAHSIQEFQAEATPCSCAGKQVSTWSRPRPHGAARQAESSQ